MKGGLEDLLDMERDLCMHMGFGPEYGNDKKNFPEESYLDMCKKYNVEEIEAKEENMMVKDFGNVLLLKEFPVYTSPFWNMRMDGDISRKVDVILGGNETIGSAERSCDKDVMRDMFMNISEG